MSGCELLYPASPKSLSQKSKIQKPLLKSSNSPGLFYLAIEHVPCAAVVQALASATCLYLPKQLVIVKQQVCFQSILYRSALTKKNMEHSLNDVASVKSSQNGDHHPKILAKKTRSARSRSSNRASKNVILHQPYHPQEHDHNIRDISN